MPVIASALVAQPRQAEALVTELATHGIISAAFHAVAAVNQLLPEMLAKRSGTILFTTSASSVHPAPRFGAVGGRDGLAP